MAEYPLIGTVTIKVEVNESWEGIDPNDSRENFLEWLHESITDILDVDAEIEKVDINGQ